MNIVSRFAYELIVLVKRFKYWELGRSEVC